jgi:HAD superfamily hydrolase (TIGR01509 family)
MTDLQAVVLDFDGVIADTEPLHFEACREVLAPLGITLTWEEYTERYIGLADPEVFLAVAKRHGLAPDLNLTNALLARKTSVLRRVLAHARPLFPGVAELMTRWSAVVPLAIASGALRSEIELILGTAGLAGTFGAIVAAGDVPRSKPAPDPYLQALAWLKPHAGPLLPAHCVAVEDSRWGIQSARAAGMRTVAVTTSFTAVALADADLVVDALSSLTLEVLDALCT